MRSPPAMSPTAPEGATGRRRSSRSSSRGWTCANSTTTWKRSSPLTTWTRTGSYAISTTRCGPIWRRLERSTPRWSTPLPEDPPSDVGFSARQGGDVDVAGRSVEDHGAVTEGDTAVRPGDEVHLMGRHDDGRPGLVGVVQQLHQGHPAGRVEADEGLVDQQEGERADQSEEDGG